MVKPVEMIPIDSDRQQHIVYRQDAKTALSVFLRGGF